MNTFGKIMILTTEPSTSTISPENYLIFFGIMIGIILGFFFGFYIKK